MSLPRYKRLGMNRAYEATLSAKILYNSGYKNDALSRLYYAVFHIMSVFSGGCRNKNMYTPTKGSHVSVRDEYLAKHNKSNGKIIYKKQNKMRFKMWTEYRVLVDYKYLAITPEEGKNVNYFYTKEEYDLLPLILSEMLDFINTHLNYINEAYGLNADAYEKISFGDDTKFVPEASTPSVNRIRQSGIFGKNSAT